MIDKAGFKEAYGEYGDEFIIEILGIFISEYNGGKKIIEKLFKERNLEGLESYFFKLKGNAGHLIDFERNELFCRLYRVLSYEVCELNISTVSKIKDSVAKCGEELESLVDEAREFRKEFISNYSDDK